MRSEIPDHLRRLIIERAGNRCEYCLLPQWAALHKHEPNHLIPHYMVKSARLCPRPLRIANFTTVTP